MLSVHEITNRKVNIKMVEELDIQGYIVRKADDIFYQKTHEWVKDNGDGTWSMGVDDFVVKMLREIADFQLPEEGEVFEEGDIIAYVEALKTTGEIYAPFKLEIVEANEDLYDDPDVFSESPYDDGWLVKFKKLEEPSEPLLDAEAYIPYLKEEAAKH